MFLKLLLKHDNSNSNILLLQDPNRHLSSMALILWTTKDQALILISSLGVNMLFYVAGSSYPTIKSSQRLALLFQHGSISEIGQKFRDRVSQSKHHYFPASPQSQKPPELPQDNRYSSQNKTHSIPSSKSLETSCMSCHTTTPEIPDMFILSLVLVPT
jgi:hypothetical protein